MKKTKELFTKYHTHILIGIFSGILNGLFGAGGGSVVVPAMEKFLNTDEKKSHSTAILIILIMSIVSSVIYIRQGFYDMQILIYTSVGGALGGAVGAKLLKTIPKKLLKIIFSGVIIATAIKMIMN